jgi:hypothetical protein
VVEAAKAVRGRSGQRARAVPVIASTVGNSIWASYWTGDVTSR